MAGSSARQQERAAHVDADHLFQRILLHLHESAHGYAGRVVDQDSRVQTGDGVPDCLGKIRLGEIERHATGLYAVFRMQPVREDLEQVALTRDQHHVQAAPGEFERKRGAEPLRRAHDHGPLAVAGRQGPLH